MNRLMVWTIGPRLRRHLLHEICHLPDYQLLGVVPHISVLSSCAVLVDGNAHVNLQVKSRDLDMPP